ncbi:hypothetical protein HDU86_001726 [Geranomyces michiganensis]|nr:hypothetical protein HDU86_001726 [Geranomyces michiganensis]
MPVMTATAHLADGGGSPGGSSHGHYSRAHSRSGTSGRNSSEGIFPPLQQWGLPPVMRGPSPTPAYTTRGLRQQYSQHSQHNSHGHHNQHTHDAHGPSTLKLPQIPSGNESYNTVVRTPNAHGGHTPHMDGPSAASRRHHGGDAVEHAASLLAHARRDRSAGKHATATTLLPSLQPDGGGGKLYGLTLARNLTVQQPQSQQHHLQPRRSPSPPLHVPPHLPHHQFFPGPFEARLQSQVQASPVHMFSRRKSSPRGPPRGAAGDHHRHHDEHTLPPLMPPDHLYRAPSSPSAPPSAHSRRRAPQKSAGAVKLPDLTRRRGAGG